MLKKFAEELKENRIKNDITLQQVAAKTRIDIKFLEAIEQGNFDILPEVYLKAFLKGYANATGLDENQTLRRYDAARAGRNVEDAPAAQAEIPEPKKEVRIEKPKREYTMPEITPDDDIDDSSSSARSSRNNIIILILGGLLVLLAIIAYFVFKPSSSEIVTEKPYEEMIEENRQRFEPPADTTAAAAPVTQAADDSLTLSIKSADMSYIRVNPDSARAIEFNIQPNSERRIKAKKGFRVVIGNAASIQMSLNDKPLNFVTGRGEVVVVRVDANGISYVKPPKSLQKNE